MEYQLYHTLDEIQIIGKDLDSIKEDVYSLWQMCFGDTKEYTDFYFRWKVVDNQILSMYKENVISSMLHLNPYELMVQGKNIVTNYIVGVATREDDRRKGLMKTLLETAINQMYKQNMPFTYLMPAKESIYLPFGFRIVYNQEKWNQNIREIIGKSEDNSETKNYEDKISIILLGNEDTERIDELVSFSNKILSENYDVFVKRNAQYYKRLIHEMMSTSGEVELIYKGNELIGYVSYMAESSIYITECLYAPKDEEIVMKLIASYGLTVNQVERSKEIKASLNSPAIMARIIHWDSFIQNVTAKDNISLVVKVIDPIIEENNGVYTLNFSNNGCVTMKTDQTPEISADISDLTKLFFGKLDSSDFDVICLGDKEYMNEKIKKINMYQNVFINDVV